LHLAIAYYNLAHIHEALLRKEEASRYREIIFKKKIYNREEEKKRMRFLNENKLFMFI